MSMTEYQFQEGIVMHGINPKRPSQRKCTIALSTVRGDRRSTSRKKSNAWTVRFYSTQRLDMVGLAADTLGETSNSERWYNLTAVIT